MDSPFRALVDAGSTALAIQWVHAIEIIPWDDGIKPADLVAAPAQPALVRVDDGYLAAHEKLFFEPGRV